MNMSLARHCRTSSGGDWPPSFAFARFRAQNEELFVSEPAALLPAVNRAANSMKFAAITGPSGFNHSFSLWNQFNLAPAISRVP